GSGFAYTETNGSFSGQATAYLESPCFDLTDSIDQVQFFYQIAGNVDSFRLEVSYDDGISYNETVLDIPIATYSDWERENRTGLSIMGSVRFRFVVVFNSGSSGIVALDQLQLFGTNNGELTDCADIDCVENLTLNNTTLSEELYRAKQQLSSNATIESSQDVTFTAGNQIILKEGFVASNTTFTARIQDCNSIGAALLEYYERPDPPLVENVAYFDRFGNGYSQEELEIEFLNADTACYTGVFRLNFPSNITNEEQEVTCAVFSYLDSLIETNAPDSSVVIDIKKDTIDAATLATGTPYWNRLDCGIANSVVEKILIGANPNLLGISHGEMRINEFFENRFFTDLVNPPSSTDNGNFHLYTIMLHEALHVLGFASLIDGNSTPLDITAQDSILEGQAFSRWDQYLVSKIESDYLLATIMDDCCDTHSYQLMNEPTSGCTIAFREDG
ncbi:MAG: 3-coathanger stack domain-containing protein, partial [Bacteroidota bacterium]